MRSSIGLLGGVVIWEMAVRGGIVDDFFLASPVQMVQKIDVLREQAIWVDLWVTLKRLVLGLLIGGPLGYLVGFLIGSFAGIRAVLVGWVDLFRSIPVAALFPLFLLMFGTGDYGKILITAWSSALVFLVHVGHGYRTIPKEWMEVGKALRMSRARRFIHISLPATMPDTLAGLQQATSIGIIVVLVAEMFFGSQDGIGHVIHESTISNRVELMQWAVLFTGLFGVFVNLMLARLQDALCPWSGLGSEVGRGRGS